MSMQVPEVARDLYAAPPDAFVASRNALAKQLKADGDDATAAVVSKLRRPTVSAAAVNAAAREHPELVHELLEAGERLAGVQRKLLSGKAAAADELRTVSDERRRLVRTLADAAIALPAADGRSVDHLRDEIAGTFEAATLDDELGRRLRDGTVEKAVTPSAGLGGLEGFAVIPGGASASEKEEPTEESADDAPSRAQRAAEDAAEEAARARAEADAAVQAADRAAEDAQRLAGAAEAAERAAREARAEERRLRDEASTAKRRAERAERAAKTAADRAAR